MGPAEQADPARAGGGGPRRPVRLPRLAIAAGALVVLAVVVALWAGGRSEPRRPPAAATTAAPAPATTPVPKDARADAPSAPVAVACGGKIPPRHQHLRFRVPPHATAIASQHYLATFQTSCGRFTVRLDPKATPITTFNFVFLAQRHFYDATWFHRILPAGRGPVGAILGGDPGGDGQGGPGYSIRDELPTAKRPYKKYTMAMANTGEPDSGGSQFFISTVDNPRIPPRFSLFGMVVAGRSVIDRIAGVPVGGSDGATPTRAVWVETVTIRIT
jgi:cyclophilin family peptidyl-prolyl cis-trans isomerase